MTNLNNSFEPAAEKNLTHVDKIKTQFMYLLDDFSKYYVFSHKNPEVMEYQHNLDELKSQLQALNTELFKVGQSVHSSINQLNASIAKRPRNWTMKNRRKKDYPKLCIRLKTRKMVLIY